MGDEEYIPFKEIPGQVQFADFRMFYYCKTKMDWVPDSEHTHINLERVEYIRTSGDLYSVYLSGGDTSQPLLGKFISYPQYFG